MDSVTHLLSEGVLLINKNEQNNQSSELDLRENGLKGFFLDWTTLLPLKKKLEHIWGYTLKLPCAGPTRGFSLIKFKKIKIEFLILSTRPV